MSDHDLLDDLRRYTAAVADSIDAATVEVSDRPEVNRRRPRIVAVAAALVVVALGAAFLVGQGSGTTNLEAQGPAPTSTDGTTATIDTGSDSLATAVSGVLDEAVVVVTPRAHRVDIDLRQPDGTGFQVTVYRAFDRAELDAAGLTRSSYSGGTLWIGADDSDLSSVYFLSNDGIALWLARSPSSSTTDPAEDLGPLALQLTEQEAVQGAALDVVAELKIDAIELHYIVVEGTSVDQLKKGPGHEPGTALPGRAGNSVILGHRTTYLAVFNRLDELEPGDLIEITTAEGQFTYVVQEARVIDRGDLSQVDDSYWADSAIGGFSNALTLVTPDPTDESRQRILIGAELVGAPAAN